MQTPSDTGYILNFFCESDQITFGIFDKNAGKNLNKPAKNLADNQYEVHTDW